MCACSRQPYGFRKLPANAAAAIHSIFQVPLPAAYATANDGPRKKLACTFAQSALNAVTAITGKKPGRGARSRYKNAARRKIHPNTCGLASQWTLAAVTMMGDRIAVEKKSPPTVKLSRTHIQVHNAIAMAN